jgi:hypothetical protein
MTKPNKTDEPTQVRTIAWTHHTPTVAELREWLDRLPNKAILTFTINPNTDTVEIRAHWDIP